MKRLIASAGLVALGAASVKAIDYAPGFASTDMSKPWSVAVTLRGFYDDNYLTAPDRSGNGAPPKLDSYGCVIAPSGSVAFSTDQTDLAARYTFSAYYFEDQGRNKEPWDLTHQFEGFLNHNFTRRLNTYVADSFTVSSESQILDPGGSGTPYRTEQDNIRNTGSITVNAQVTELLTLVLGYQNTYYDYGQDAGDVIALSIDRNPDSPTYGTPLNPLGVGSYSALLDRVEHLILANLQWQLTPQTVGAIGYNFGMIDYTSDDLISGPTVWNPFAIVLTSDIRNSRTHFVYAGVDHAFNPDFTLSLRAGAQYADFYNQSPSYTAWGPYANLSVRYTYAAGSHIDVGFSQQFNQTDVLANNASVSLVYATLAHAFTPQLVGSVTGRYQYSEYNSQPAAGLPVTFDDTSDNLYSVGLNLAYHINRHVSAEIGYNFDKLEPGPKSWHYDYTRNVVYIGITARY